jgi:hypothetical protein
MGLLSFELDSRAVGVGPGYLTERRCAWTPVLGGACLSGSCSTKRQTAGMYEPCDHEQGALQNKTDGPPRGWLVPRRPKKYQGWSDPPPPDFFIVFLNSPHRETPKNVIKKNREKIGFGFFCKTFFGRFLWSIYLGLVGSLEVNQIYVGCRVIGHPKGCVVFFKGRRGKKKKRRK